MNISSSIANSAIRRSSLAKYNQRLSSSFIQDFTLGDDFISHKAALTRQLGKFIRGIDKDVDTNARSQQRYYFFSPIQEGLLCFFDDDQVNI